MGMYFARVRTTRHRPERKHPSGFIICFFRLFFFQTRLYTVYTLRVYVCSCVLRTDKHVAGVEFSSRFSSLADETDNTKWIFNVLPLSFTNA